MNLSIGTLLQGGKYKIEKVLGQGGFGITYLAYHEMLECKVAIKEFFFKEYCDRNESTSHVTLGTAANRPIVERFQQKFIKEAKTIFKLRHPNIVQIHDIFTENGTAYYVMEYVDGESLGEIVKRVGVIPEHEAIGYIKKVGSALSYIHSLNLNHLDVKPGNIMIRKSDNQVILIDFGVAKQYDAETQEGTTTTPVGISHGYSPLEQYRSNGVQEFSPQSDVYALAATLFKLLTGNTPPEAIEIQEEGVPVEDLKAKNVSSDTINAIEAAMKSRKKRTQTVDELINSLGGKESTTKTETYKIAEKIEEDSTISDNNSLIVEENCKSDIIEEVGENKPIEEYTTEDTILFGDINKVPSPEEVKFCKDYDLCLTENGLVDMGLSVLWRSCNWGTDNPASSGTLLPWDYIKYTQDGYQLRLPTTEEFKELKDNCNWKWVEEEDICGYLITSPFTGNRIFLRASGKNGENDYLGTNMGFYWSNNNAASGDNAYNMTFMLGTIICYSQNPKETKMSVRLIASI